MASKWSYKNHGIRVFGIHFSEFLNMAIWKCSNQSRYLDACVQEQKPSLNSVQLRVQFLDGSVNLLAFCEGLEFIFTKIVHFFPCSDQWNVLDLTTLIIYLVIFVLRMITWGLSNSEENDRVLLITGYLYGLSTLILTFRAFGHMMENTREVGSIQIALFHIVSDVVAIFWQFIAAILAFSIAITKVYMAEKSYLEKDNRDKNT